MMTSSCVGLAYRFERTSSPGRLAFNTDGGDSLQVLYLPAVAHLLAVLEFASPPSVYHKVHQNCEFVVWDRASQFFQPLHTEMRYYVLLSFLSFL